MSVQAELHFQAAARSEPGLQSMEVVSRLAQSGGPLPDGFLQVRTLKSLTQSLKPCSTLTPHAPFQPCMQTLAALTRNMSTAQPQRDKGVGTS